MSFLGTFYSAQSQLMRSRAQYQAPFTKVLGKNGDLGSARAQSHVEHVANSLSFFFKNEIKACVLTPGYW